MSVFSGDFLGFTLGDIHSSQLNITRVSVNDRYDDTLIPTLKDLVAEVPGGDGTYYWDTNYTQRQFILNFAYDDLRDEDLRALRQLFGFKGIKPFILDEFPYKKYMVKCAASPSFKYICFDHLEMRLYKGEGTVNLIAYYPFAMATFSPFVKSNTTAVLNNVGDLPAQIKICYPINGATVSLELRMESLEGNLLGIMNFKPIEPIGMDDTYILIDSKTHLIEGLDQNHKKTGNLYNQFLDTGNFFNAPVGRTYIKSNQQFEKVEYTPLYY